MTSHVRVGCAGWSIPKEVKDRFPAEGSHLARYARVFPAVEINSSFYRYHEPATYERWARETPPGFRFSLKAPREVTHFRRLARPKGPLERFLDGARRLGKKLGPVLVQLPPSLAFDRPRASRFFRTLRSLHEGPVACEPRHPSWFCEDAARILVDFEVARAAADPACVEEAARPGGSRKLVYHRLHGSPQMYHSPYSECFLQSLAERILQLPKTAQVWCIFDNTAAGAAFPNGLRLIEGLGKGR